MNSSDPSKANATSSSSSNGEEKALAAGHEEDSLLPVSKRDRFLSTYRRQNFALPDSIMHYMAMNPATPKGYQSFIKSSKYFFLKNPIIVLTDGVWKDQKWGTYVNGRYHVVVDLKKLCSKIWITGRFSVSTIAANTQSIVSNIIPRFYRFDANEFFTRDQVISFNDYTYLSSSVERVSLGNITVKDENDSIVAMEKLAETAAKANIFSITCNTANITSTTAKELFEKPNFSRFKFFNLNSIPQAFDIEVFYEYMKKNKTTSFSLNFDDTISDAYKARLGAIIDEILGTETLDYEPPLFNFIGINIQKYLKLASIFSRR